MLAWPVNPAYQGRVDDIAAITDLHEYKRRVGLLLWGGDKTWLAPQDRWTDGVPFVDLDSGAYELSLDPTTGAATVTSPVCREAQGVVRWARFNELLARHPLPSVKILHGYAAASESP